MNIKKNLKAYLLALGIGATTVSSTTSCTPDSLLANPTEKQQPTETNSLSREDYLSDPKSLLDSQTKETLAKLQQYVEENSLDDQEAQLKVTVTSTEPSKDLSLTVQIANIEIKTDTLAQILSSITAIDNLKISGCSLKNASLKEVPDGEIQYYNSIEFTNCTGTLELQGLGATELKFFKNNDIDLVETSSNYNYFPNIYVDRYFHGLSALFKGNLNYDQNSKTRINVYFDTDEEAIKDTDLIALIILDDSEPGYTYLGDRENIDLKRNQMLSFYNQLLFQESIDEITEFLEEHGLNNTKGESNLILTDNNTYTLNISNTNLKKEELTTILASSKLDITTINIFNSNLEDLSFPDLDLPELSLYQTTGTLDLSKSEVEKLSVFNCTDLEATPRDNIPANANNLVEINTDQVTALTKDLIYSNTLFNSIFYSVTVNYCTLPTEPTLALNSLKYDLWENFDVTVDFHTGPTVRVLPDENEKVTEDTINFYLDLKTIVCGQFVKKEPLSQPTPKTLTKKKAPKV